MTLEEEDEAAPDPVTLVAGVVRRRGELEEAVRGPRAIASREIGYSLAYDAVLVRLCVTLGVDEELTKGANVAVARRQAEERLVERLPSIALALVNPLA